MFLGRRDYFLGHRHRCLTVPQQGLPRRRLLLLPPPLVVWPDCLLWFVVGRMPKKSSGSNKLIWGDEAHETEVGSAEGCPLREATGMNMVR